MHLPHPDMTLDAETLRWRCYAFDHHEPTQKRNEDLLRLVEVSDGSDYQAHLHTAPEFGCFLWEAKKG